MAVRLHEGDVPEGYDFGSAVAIDTETMGLAVGRDRLCVVQLSCGDGKAACAAGETMISAYCVGDNATAKISDTSGAACEGGKAVIACVKK